MLEIPPFRRFSLLLPPLCAAALLVLPACNRRETAPPVVHVTPVLTRPYEDGYAAGFDQGQAAATPRAKLPKADDVQAKAIEAAGDDPLHEEKWRRGWASGYMDGFRAVATHQR